MSNLITGITELADEEDTAMYGYADLYQQLLTEDDGLIYTIPLPQVERFKKGMSVAKSRLTNTWAEQGIPADPRVLSFTVLPITEQTPTSCVEIQVALTSRTGVTVYSIRKPDPSL